MNREDGAHLAWMLSSLAHNLGSTLHWGEEDRCIWNADDGDIPSLPTNNLPIPTKKLTIIVYAAVLSANSLGIPTRTPPSVSDCSTNAI